MIVIKALLFVVVVLAGIVGALVATAGFEVLGYGIGSTLALAVMLFISYAYEEDISRKHMCQNCYNKMYK